MGGNKFKLDEVQKKFQASKRGLIQKVANESESFFRKGFIAGGFTDSSFERWQPRKNKKSTKPVLTGTGRLRRSIRLQITSSSTAKLYTDIPYAAIHNEGGDIHRNATSRVISFSNAGGGSRFAKTKTKKQRAAVTHQSRSTTSGYTIEMPKRKFMGKSRTLDQRINKLISKEIGDIFKK